MSLGLEMSDSFSIGVFWLLDDLHLINYIYKGMFSVSTDDLKVHITSLVLQVIKENINKEFCEELIVYFPLIRHGPRK
jgi:hypothetical protein